MTAVRRFISFGCYIGIEFGTSIQCKSLKYFGLAERIEYNERNTMLLIIAMPLLLHELRRHDDDDDILM